LAKSVACGSVIPTNGCERRRSMSRLSSSVALLLGTIAILYQVSFAQDASLRFVRLKGANVMVNTLDKVGQEFTRSNPDVRVIVGGGGTAVGFEAFCEKSCDIVMASRKINEKEQQLLAVCGAHLTEVAAGWDCVAIVVNPANSVSELTKEQLGKLFTGEVNDWSQVGGPKGPVAVIASPGHTGTADFLRQFVMEEGYFTGEASIKDRYFEILKEVQRRPNAIGYAALPDADMGVSKGMVKILSIRATPNSPAVRPSAQSLRDGTYLLRQPLFLYWNGPTAKKDVKDFMEFYLKGRAGR